MRHTERSRKTKKNSESLASSNIIHIFATAFKSCTNMVAVVQLVRASDCGSECRGFESHLPPTVIILISESLWGFSFYKLS